MFSSTGCHSFSFGVQKCICRLQCPLLNDLNYEIIEASKFAGLGWTAPLSLSIPPSSSWTRTVWLAMSLSLSLSNWLLPPVCYPPSSRSHWSLPASGPSAVLSVLSAVLITCFLLVPDLLVPADYECSFGIAGKLWTEWNFSRLWS